MNDDYAAESDRQDLITNPSPRCACILVLDTSGSMSGIKIQQLNEGIRQFLSEVQNDEIARFSVELGVITAGGIVRDELAVTPVHAIESVKDFNANGGTPLGGAVARALEMLDSRKASYKSAGVSYYQPWLVIISDGIPTDAWDQAADQAKSLADAKKLVVLPIGVDHADLAVLTRFSNRPAKQLAGLKFREFFQWLSASMQRVSGSTPGTSVALPSTAGWDSI